MKRPVMPAAEWWALGFLVLFLVFVIGIAVYSYVTN